MSDIEVKSENKFALLFRNITSSPEKKFFTLFIALSIISWSAGIASLQVHEAQVKREAAAVKLAEEKAKKDRLTKLDSLWAKSKYKSWQSFEYVIVDIAKDFFERKLKVEQDAELLPTTEGPYLKIVKVETT